VAFEVVVEHHEALPTAAAAPFRLDTLPALIAEVLAAEEVADGTAVTLLLAADDLLHELNREHRGVDGPTDVLSFASDDGEPFPGAPDPEEPPYLGDIVISLPIAARQAAEAGLTPDLELRHLVVHGLLHILGYDHEVDADRVAMEAREESFLGPAIHAGGHDGHD